MSAVLKFPDVVNQERVERLTSNLERDSAELLELMQKQDCREFIGHDLYRLGLTAIRCQTVLEDFK